MEDSLPANPSRAIAALCERFETEWQEGRRPMLETYLHEGPADAQARLLQELLALELEYRLRLGERPLLSDYQSRFPGQDALLQTVFRKPVAPLPARPRSSPPTSSGSRLTLTATDGPLAGQVFTFAGHDVFLVGRSKEAHLQMQDGYFSRIHFMIEANPPDCRVTDMGSRNGTYVNDQRIQQPVPLRDGDQIKAGHTILRVSLSGPETTALDPEVCEARTSDLPGIVTPTEPLTDLHAGPLAEGEEIPGSETQPARDRGEPDGQSLTQYATRAPRAAPAGDALPALQGYELIRELGRGGMGVVYLAVRDADGTEVAIKTIRPAVAASHNQVRRFFREAIILCQLQHKHIVTFYEMGEGDGYLFFAMDYVAGTDAARMLKEQGPLSVRTAVRMICQVLSALEYAHGKGFVHRDVKPGNLLVADDGTKKTVKVTDFGLWRVYQQSRLSGLTIQGDIGGTVAFMPPEQITQFRQVQPAADQYSTAATLYALLTGCAIFDFKGKALPPLSIVLQEPPVPLRERRTDLPEELEAILHRALAKDPKDRFPDVAAFRDELLPFAK